MRRHPYIDVAVSVLLLLTVVTAAQDDPQPEKELRVGGTVTIRVVIDGEMHRVTGVLKGVYPDHVLIDSRRIHYEDIMEADRMRLRSSQLPQSPSGDAVGTRTTGSEGMGTRFSILLGVTVLVCLVLFCTLALGFDAWKFLTGGSTPRRTEGPDLWERADPDWGESISEAKKIDLSYDLAVLELCMEELEDRLGRGDQNAWMWKTKLKVAKLMATQLRHRIDWDWEESFTDEDKAEILAEHPLLEMEKSAPPDMTKDYSHQQWYRDIRRKVERYVASRRARGDVGSG